MLSGVIWHLFCEIAIKFKLLGCLLWFEGIICNTYEMEWEYMKETGKYTHYSNKEKIWNSFLCPIQGLNNANYCMSNDSLLIDILSFPLVGKGVANLLISLPRLTLLICEPYLLREGIKFVHSINVNSFTYKLTYLHTRFPDRDFLMYVLTTCFHEFWIFFL